MIQDILRRVRNALAFGFTTAPVAAPGNIPAVQVRLTPLEGPTLRLVEQRGFASNLPVGTPIVALFQGGDRSNGVVVGSTAPGTRPALEGPEDAAVYGYGFLIIIKADGVHITAPDLFLSGNLHVDGKIEAKGNVTALFGTGASVTLPHHTHGGPPPTPGT